MRASNLCSGSRRSCCSAEAESCHAGSLRLGRAAVAAGDVLRLYGFHRAVGFSDFLKEHPQGKIHLDEGSMQKHLQMIQSEKLDLAYNGFPDTQDLPGIETIPISKAEIRIVLHPDHQLAKQERIPLSLLAGEKLVMMDAQSKVKRLMDEAFEQQHLSMNVVLNYTQILCMVSLVKSAAMLASSARQPDTAFPAAKA